MDIKIKIEKLLQWSIKNDLLKESDYFFARNNILNLLKIDVPAENKIEVEKTEKIYDLLNPIIDYAVNNKLISNSITEKDRFDAQIMGLIIARPSEIIRKFESFKVLSGSEIATNWYYDYSQKTNYIRIDRISKNKSWKTETEFGDLELTINISKPEKDPKEIAEAKNKKSSGYPKCILCAENEGYHGDFEFPARQNHRLIPLKLIDEPWYLQYSPYVYFNEHCIVLSKEHRPMKIESNTFLRLLEFVVQFPHYFMGSNADLPIVGGSLLSHDHFQGGNYNFPMAKANYEYVFDQKNYPEIEIGIVKWQMSVIRLKSKNIKNLVLLADLVLKHWKNYSNHELNIYSHTQEESHNTITPICRFRDNKYELDLVLRNNKTTDEFPDGIFHPHQNLHHLKKENIGLIEVMGLAILPGRLIEELDLIEKHLMSSSSISDICKNNPSLEKHKTWIEYLRKKYKTIDKNEIFTILKNEVGFKFSDVLSDSGVFKNNKTGKNAFVDFINEILK